MEHELRKGDVDAVTVFTVFIELVRTPYLKATCRMRVTQRGSWCVRDCSHVCYVASSLIIKFNSSQTNNFLFSNDYQQYAYFFVIKRVKGWARISTQYADDKTPWNF